MAIVCSHPKHFDHRKAIRSTWGNDFNNLHMIDSNLHGQIIFQVGLEPRTHGIDKLIKDESDQFGDILIQDFIEHYNNLTIKTVMLLKYVNHLPVIPSFIFKVCMYAMSFFKSRNCLYATSINCCGLLSFFLLLLLKTF